MTNLRLTVVSIAIAAASFGAFAQTDAAHTQHHPVEPAKNVAKAVAPKSPSIAKETMAAMDSKMKSMREMREKMMAAKTPEERKALMGDHMKAMQDGMAMMEKMDAMDAMDAMGGMSGMGDMKGMGGADAKKSGMPMDMMGMHEMMQKRMEMMTSMMQMMMDRLPASPAQ